MKLLKIFGMACVASFSAASFNASAAGATTVSCNWVLNDVNSFTGGATVTQSCMATTQELIATRVATYINDPITPRECTITPSTGISFSGSCTDPVFERENSTRAAAPTSSHTWQSNCSGTRIGNLCANYLDSDSFKNARYHVCGSREASLCVVTVGWTERCPGPSGSIGFGGSPEVTAYCNN